jgi:nicotinate-nucleotide adenylyltransferase
MDLLPVSATAIRQRLAQGQAVADLLDPQVARYIAQHHLYQAP